jgi:deoxyribonuclease V
MNYRRLHSWDVTPTEAVRLQKQLRTQVRLEPFPGQPRLIAGADISFNKYSKTVYAAFVVLDAFTLETVETANAIVEVKFPYVPGLLSFREIPPLLRAWEQLRSEPDVIVLDGQGIAHPRRLGIAAHIGLFLDRPTIGCAKSRLTGTFAEPGLKAGSWSPLVDRGETLGAVLRTKDRVNPVFISPGHRMDLESAVRIVRGTVRGYRIPEPTRQAHLWVNELRRDAGEHAA